MPHKIRKTRKKRGTRTVGYGRVGQHRKSGMRGGHGKAGGHKHLWTYTLKYQPDYFGKKGFYSARSEEAKVLNLGKLEDLAAKLHAESSLEERNGVAFLDLDKLGYDKLLGMGNITKPFSIKIASYSKLAAKKVEEAGGKIATKTKSAND